jgi:ATP-binding cassette subfamily B protein
MQQHRCLARILRTIWTLNPVYVIGTIADAFLKDLQPVLLLAITKVLVDRVSAPSTGTFVSNFVPLLGAFFLLTVGSDIIDRFSRVFLQTKADRIAHALTANYIDAVNSIPNVAPFDDPTFHNQMQLARRGTGPQFVAVFRSAVTCLTGSLVVVGIAWLLFSLSPWLFILILATALPGIWLQARVNRRSIDTLRQLSPEERRLAYWNEVLTGVSCAKEIRLFSAFPFFRKKWSGAFEESLKIQHRLRDQREIASSFGVVIAMCGVVGGMVFACYQAFHGLLGPGDVVLVFGLVRQGSGSFYGLITQTASLHENLLLVSEYFAFVDTYRPQAVVQGAPFRPPSDQISFRDICFSYTSQSRPVFSGLSFSIPAGKVTAIIGRNGSGKSTLIKLLTRLVEPQRGGIYFDGVDIASFSISEYHRNCSVVFQDFGRYTLSMRENILMCDDDGMLPSRETSVLHWAQLDQVAARLSLGVNTPLGRTFANGVDLSGGEWQRVALARSFIRDAAIVILDEPTASLDVDSEIAVLKQFRHHTAGRTAIVVTHRFLSAQQADFVVVLGESGVIEAGTHDELLTIRGEYARLLQEQGLTYSVPC